VSAVAIIPARGGSRGIPRKNLCAIAGKPLIAYTIEHAKATPAIERVIVSTDDAEIAATAERYGAEVVWRPAEISGNTAASETAVIHALDELARRDQYRPDLVVLLQATSPLRAKDDVQRAIETLLDEGADSLFSACTVHGFVWRQSGCEVSSLSYDYRARQPRQAAPVDFIENGSIYVTRREWLYRTGNRLGGRIAVYRMDPLDSFQVDEPGDLVLIERLLRSRTIDPPTVDLSDIDLLVLDFDGVLTDNRVLIDEHGTEAVWCHRGDGWGIARLRDTGVEVVVLSTETNPVVAARCGKLRIEAIQSCDDKLEALKELAASRRLAPSRIAYVGNDANDIACLQWVGVPIAVADATVDVRRLCPLVSSRRGGHGAVREIADWICRARLESSISRSLLKPSPSL
jgi:YrbI family 3-deoxy-D-manno-octulosonate 8-phosphate phosphatase